MAFPVLTVVVGLLVPASIVLSARPLSGPAVPPDAAERDQGALAATTVPPESWEGVSQRLARSLVDADVRLNEQPLFLPKALVRQFGRTDVQLPASLQDHFEGCTILGIQSFEYPNATLAVDTGRVLQRVREQDPQAIPELLVRAMTPPAEEASAAEQAASRWITAALNPVKGDHLAVILLWNASEPNLPMLDRLSFVLVKAGRLPDGRFRIQSASYGTAQQAVLDGA